MSIETATGTVVKDVASVGGGIVKAGAGLYTKLLTYIVLAIALIGIGAGPTWYYTRKYEVDYYTAQIEKGNTAAQMEITELTAQKGAVELQLAEAKNDIQNKYEKQAAADAAAIAKLHATNTKLYLNLANKGGGSANAGTASSTSGGNGSGASSVLLPQPTSDNLLDLARQADDLSSRLLACQQWVNTTQQKLSDWEKQNQDVPKPKKSIFGH